MRRVEMKMAGVTSYDIGSILERAVITGLKRRGITVKDFTHRRYGCDILISKTVGNVTIARRGEIKNIDPDRVRVTGSYVKTQVLRFPKPDFLIVPSCRFDTDGKLLLRSIKLFFIPSQYLGCVDDYPSIRSLIRDMAEWLSILIMSVLGVLNVSERVFPLRSVLLRARRLGEGVRWRVGGLVASLFGLLRAGLVGAYLSRGLKRRGKYFMTVGNLLCDAAVGENFSEAGPARGFGRKILGFGSNNKAR